MPPSVTHMFARLRRSVAELARLAECKRVGPFTLRPRYVMRRLSSTHLLPVRPVKAIATRIAAPATPFVLGVVAGFVGAAAVGTAECIGGDGADAASNAEMMSMTATWSTNPLIKQMCGALRAAGHSSKMFGQLGHAE